MTVPEQVEPLDISEVDDAVVDVVAVVEEEVVETVVVVVVVEKLEEEVVDERDCFFWNYSLEYQQ